jgi:hypothetical protein
LTGFVAEKQNWNEFFNGGESVPAYFMDTAYQGWRVSQNNLPISKSELPGS